MSRTASNAYGFDFLKAEHTLNNEGGEDPTLVGAQQQQSQLQPTYETEKTTTQQTEDNHAALVAAAAAKNPLEKQFDILAFLQAHRSSRCIPPSIIYAKTGIDLSEGGADESVAKMLEKNPKVCIEEMPDPENPSLMILTYGYQAKFNNVHDKIGLLAQINRCKNGVATRDLLDAYEGVLGDINALITAGDVLAVMNPEDKDRVLFPRGETFLVELDGHVTVPDVKLNNAEVEAKMKDLANKVSSATSDPVVLAAIQKAQLEKRRRQQQRAMLENCTIVDTDVDPLKQIRRGEAICVGGQWFRVSSAVKDGVPLSEQPTRAQAPPTVTSLKDLSKKNEQDGYIRMFNEKKIPLDHPLPQTALQNLRDAKKAREQLHHFAGNGRVVTGGASSQLLSSSASAANPSTLAAAFAKSVAAAASGAGGGGHMRKRPGGSGRGGANADGGGLGGGGVHHPPGGGAGGVGGMDRASVAETIETAKRAASDPSLVYSHARRHGCTKDVREMYLATVKDVPESEIDLHNLMIEYKLIEPGEAMRLPRMKKKNANVDNDGKPKKRRYYLKKGQRITNTHLEGTEIGAVLAKAAEKQSQGKAVGDGGM